MKRIVSIEKIVDGQEVDFTTMDLLEALELIKTTREDYIIGSNEQFFRINGDYFDYDEVNLEVLQGGEVVFERCYQDIKNGLFEFFMRVFEGAFTTDELDGLSLDYEVVVRLYFVCDFEADFFLEGEFLF